MELNLNRENKPHKSRRTALIYICASIIAISINVASAKNVVTEYSIAEALSSEQAKEKLGNDVTFYFGNQEYGNVSVTYGELTISKRLNLREFSQPVHESAMPPGAIGYRKTVTTDDTEEAKKACQSAFIDAMSTFRDRTLHAGGNAVINIKSNYGEEELTSGDNDKNNFRCGVGYTTVSAAFKGTVVKLAK